ncbi:MAG: LamB/YcsF family protein [Spirochaetales bacterium]|nr:LamB/YcsF family protein [Spirochaetales bacterium]
MITVNCDIGERGATHPVDIELMSYIGMANIACGGHAGDEESIKAFRDLAKRLGVKVAAHLSYPDKENFGRFSMDIPFSKLSQSLDSQYSLMSDVKIVKFHGALYNDANVDYSLATNLILWMKMNGIEEIVTPFDSILADEARKVDIQVFPEAFAERRYTYDTKLRQLLLVNRKKDYASIHDCDEAVEHARKIITEKKVFAFNDKDGELVKEEYPIEAQTICIHSDSAIALELAQKLAKI